MDSKKKLIINTITEKLSPYRNLIQFYCTFGSLSHDIDMIIILKSSENDPCNFKNLKTVISVIKDLPDEFKEQFPFTIFPSFRLQTWAEVSSLPSDGSLVPRTHQSVHLLIYPDEQRLVEWERPLLVLTLLETSRPIWGDISKISELKKSLEFPPLRQRLEYYHNLMYETYQVLEIGSIPEQALIAEVFYKIIYILKFSSLDFLYEKDSLPNPPYKLQTIKDSFKHFPDLLSVFLDCLEDYEKQNILPKKEKLFDLFDKLALFFNVLAQYAKR